MFVHPVHALPEKVRRVSRCPGTEVTDYCVGPCELWSPGRATTSALNHWAPPQPLGVL